MYSYDDKIRAVQLYIKLGKRMKATIRQLGFPTKNALKGWYREYERRGDLAKGFHRAPKYSMAQQQAAVDHFLGHGRCITFTRKALGYPSLCVLRSWIYERHPDVCKRSVGCSRAVPKSLVSISVFSVVYFNIDVARGEQTIANIPSERPKTKFPLSVRLPDRADGDIHY
jgi:hypothetical protein